jgi:hypothetical protein
MYVAAILTMLLGSLQGEHLDYHFYTVQSLEKNGGTDG